MYQQQEHYNKVTDGRMNFKFGGTFTFFFYLLTQVDFF